MMRDTPPVLFVSDAHFGAHPPPQEARKIRYFSGIVSHAREIGAEIFFMGDLFDFWFEYRYWIPKVPLEVLFAIHEFTRGGGDFHLVLGNHDIWAADYFSRDLGVHVHRQNASVTRQGLRIFLSHGDGMAKSDGGYRILKRILRFGPNVALYRLLPPDWAYRLARFFSSRSRELTSSREPKYLAEYDVAARTYLQSGYDAVVMGHLHRGWVRHLEEGWWINSGEFFERFSYVRLEDGQFHLERWTPDGESSL